METGTICNCFFAVGLVQLQTLTTTQRADTSRLLLQFWHRPHKTSLNFSVSIENYLTGSNPSRRYCSSTHSCTHCQQSFILMTICVSRACFSNYSHCLQSEVFRVAHSNGKNYSDEIKSFFHLCSKNRAKNGVKARKTIYSDDLMMMIAHNVRRKELLTIAARVTNLEGLGVSHSRSPIASIKAGNISSSDGGDIWEGLLQGERKLSGGGYFIHCQREAVAYGKFWSRTVIRFEYGNFVAAERLFFLYSSTLSVVGPFWRFLVAVE